MDPTILAGIIGALGGAARATLGLAKAVAAKKRVDLRYYLLTVVIAAVIGSAAGIVFNFHPALSLLAGYSGTDVLEGAYKAFAVQKIIVR